MRSSLQRPRGHGKRPNLGGCCVLSETGGLSLAGSRPAGVGTSCAPIPQAVRSIALPLEPGVVAQRLWRDSRPHAARGDPYLR